MAQKKSTVRLYTASRLVGLSNPDCIAPFTSCLGQAGAGPHQKPTKHVQSHCLIAASLPLHNQVTYAHLGRQRVRLNHWAAQRFAQIVTPGDWERCLLATSNITHGCWCRRQGPRQSPPTSSHEQAVRHLVSFFAPGNRLHLSSQLLRRRAPRHLPSTGLVAGLHDSCRHTFSSVPRHPRSSFQGRARRIFLDEPCCQAARHLA